MSEARLSADGARRLRVARDHILAHPEEFYMPSFSPIPRGCGTACCIGGHVLLGLKRDGLIEFGCSADVSAALGFGGDRQIYGPSDVGIGHPLSDLFYRDLSINDPAHHAKRINAFLWDYGYPEHELEPPEASERPRASQADVLQAAHALVEATK